MHVTLPLLEAREELLDALHLDLARRGLQQVVLAVDDELGAHTRQPIDHLVMLPELREHLLILLRRGHELL